MTMALKGSSKIFPPLWYAKEAEEAATFYASIFPDSHVDRVTPQMSESPSGPPGSVKVVDRDRLSTSLRHAHQQGNVLSIGPRVGP